MKKLILLVTLCISTLFVFATEQTQIADIIYHNAKIITINDRQPNAEAVAVKDGKILMVGTKDEVYKTRHTHTKLIDVQGKTMLPGFVDAHGHVMGGGLQSLSANLLSPPDGEVKDIASLQQTLRNWMSENEAAVKKIKLVIGFGYDNAQLAELRHPTHEDLDQVSKEVPIVVIHQSGHIVSVNSKALIEGEISASTPDPVGGVIQRKHGSQEPNGVLEETAAFPLLLKLLSRVGSEGATAFINAGAELWASFGYTTAQEGRASPGTVKTLQDFAAAKKLKIDIAAYPDVLLNRNIIKELASQNYSNHFRVAGAKLTIDGSPQGFTAWRDRPYYDPVGSYPPGYSGYASATAEQVKDAIDWAFSNDIQIMTHSNGEAASDQLIAMIDSATKKYGNDDRRPVLIHGQFLREDQIDSFNRLKVIPSLFPMHTFYWGDWHRDHTVGPELADNISPTGWCVKRGMKFTTHHDAPVAFPNSMRVLDATVTRRSRSGDIIGPAQRVDVMTALKAMTIWPAWQHFEEKTKGSIEVGKLADLIILDQDPTAIDPENLDQIKVLETIKEGVTVYKRTNSTISTSSIKPGTESELAFTQAMKAASEYYDNKQGHEHHNHGSSDSNACLCGFWSKLSSVMTKGSVN